MPAPGRTTTEAIVAIGRAIVEEGGADALTMQAVAGRAGVRAPSLYKRVRDRNELLRRIVEASVEDLGSRVRAAAEGPDDDPRETLARLAHALRTFAHDQPNGYRLVFGPLPPSARPGHDTLAASSAPLLEATRRLVGEEDALEAARTVTAWANGFLLMELADAFQLGGDVDRAFTWGLARIIDAVAR